MRIVHSDVAAAEDPSASVRFDPEVEATPTGSLALRAARCYKVGQERVDAIESREHEHVEWQQLHFGGKEEGETDFGGPDDLINGVTNLYPGASDGPRILLARKCYVVLRGRQPGFYGTWEECERETPGFKSSEHSMFSGVLALEQALALWRLKLWRWRVAVLAPPPPSMSPAASRGVVSLSPRSSQTPPPPGTPSERSPVSCSGLGGGRLHRCGRDASGVSATPSDWHPRRSTSGEGSHFPTAVSFAPFACQPSVEFSQHRCRS